MTCQDNAKLLSSIGAKQTMKEHSTTRRREDERLLRGKGQYVDDFQPQDMCSGYVLRSYHPHAELLHIDTADACQLPGVLLILTYEDLQREGIGNLPCVSNLTNVDGSSMYKPPRPVLASQRVRHVGEPIAFVVAQSPEIAIEAAEMIEVDYAEIPSALIGNTENVIWEQAPDNTCFDWCAGDESAAAKALQQAVHRISITVTHPRMAITPIEPRSAIGQYAPEDDSFTLEVQSQGVHSVQRVLAQDVLKIPTDRLRVITRDVGGSFGMKIFTYPEYALVLIAARLLRRPVKWTASRSESFVSDCQGRARTDFAELGLDEKGRFLALRISAVADLGAYLSYVGASVPSIYANMVTGHTYKIPEIVYKCKGMFTNAVPTDAYRGAGKPETVCTLEQLIDKAAFELNIDRIDLRRMNFVQPQDLPYTMPNQQVIDSGNFEALFDKALEISDWTNFPKRRQKSADEGKLRGIGVGMYLHSTSVSTGEICEIQLQEDGRILVLTGSQSGGQGHATALAEIAAQSLQINSSAVRVVQGDTEIFEVGAGTGGSQLLAISGNTVVRTAASFLNSLRATISDLLEAAVDDIDYREGEFFIPGTDRKITLKQISALIGDSRLEQSACVSRVGFEGTPVTHPCGAYVAELECDPNTGALDIVQIVGVDDLGNILFPQLADGQLHGSWAQAIGTCLMESIQFDEQGSGQLLSGSLMDYQLPRADDLPFLKLEKLSTMCKTNALGVKGAGEVANLGAPGAVLNALCDMLSIEKFETIRPPATPHRIWQSIHHKAH